MKPTITPVQDAKALSSLVKYLAAGIRDADFRISNCLATCAMSCVAEVETCMKQPDFKHIILSYRPNQVPSNASIFADEDAACEELGLATSIRFSAIHRQADAVHLHVVVATAAAERQEGTMQKDIARVTLGTNEFAPMTQAEIDVREAHWAR